MPKTKIIINPTTNPTLEKKKSHVPILRSYYWPFFFGAVPLMTLTIVFTIFFYPILPPVIPFFGSLREASEILALKREIFFFPVFAFAVNLVHALVIYFGRKYDALLLTIYAHFTIFVQLLILAVALRTVLVVI